MHKATEHLPDVWPTHYHDHTWPKCKPISTYMTDMLTWIQAEGEDMCFFCWHIMESTCKGYGTSFMFSSWLQLSKAWRHAELRARLETYGADLEDGWCSQRGHPFSSWTVRLETSGEPTSKGLPAFYEIKNRIFSLKPTLHYCEVWKSGFNTSDTFFKIYQTKKLLNKFH